MTEGESVSARSISASPSARPAELSGVTTAQRMDTAERWEVAPPDQPWGSSSRWIMVMILLSTVTWRSSAIYAGGLDFVVVAKALLGGLALALAWAARVNTPRSQPMGTTFVWLLLGFVTVTTFGAWTVGDLSVSGVLSVRLLMVATALVLLVKTFAPARLLQDLLAAMALVALVAAVSGIPSFFATGRLQGGVPEMHSNELSLVALLPAVGLTYLILKGEARLTHVLVLGALLITLLGTGSRTALLAFVLGALVMLPQVKRLNSLVTVLLVASIPLTLYVMVGTDLFVGYFERSGQNEGDISTLNSRSIVWSAALDYPPTEWVRWMGTGLATKQLPVTGQYWDYQSLDSSWVSALVQAGWVGATILLLWVVLAGFMTLRLPRGPRMLTQALLAAVLARSILESGLIDSSPAFLMLAMTSFILDKGPSEPRFPDRHTRPQTLLTSAETTSFTSVR